ncbi:hypothetical protein RRG08_018657 [Elysia crispata]|uniref:Uncharacterized protein n=1 Tax=Elysia crispata TaxID=231223 RepID=A0AAE0XYW1_9GAST|nr:hypothetical protein RRG08_018657 [Elysia crispata]
MLNLFVFATHYTGSPPLAAAAVRCERDMSHTAVFKSLRGSSTRKCSVIDALVRNNSGYVGENTAPPINLRYGIVSKLT